jgi:hypothetical protein
MWTGFIWFSIGPVVGCYGYGNEPSGSVKNEEFLE